MESGRSLSKVTGGVCGDFWRNGLYTASTTKSAVHNGDALMTKVTGLGCTASALCGAFAAVQPSAFRAATSAMAVMGIAGEMAKVKTQSPGSFQTAFLDALYEMGADDIKKRFKGE